LQALVAEHGADRMPELTTRAIAEQVVDFINAVKESQ